MLVRLVNGWTANPFVAGIGVFLSSPWIVLLVCLPLLIILIKKRSYIAILSIALAMGSADAITARVIKPVVGRERPCRALQGLEQPAKCGVGKSFPSGHAAVSFSFLLSAAPTVRLGWVIFAPIASLVAGSRVLLGVHYPSDVVGGAAFGSLIGGLFWFLRRRFEKKVRQT